jgi:hypothetical protein
LYQPHDLDSTAIPDIYIRTTGRVGSFFQELRVGGWAVDKRLNYILGVNYQSDEISELTYGYYPDFSGLPPNGGNNPTYYEQNRAGAVFGNISYDFAQRFTITGGARYTDARQAISGCTFDGGGGGFAGVVGGVANSLRAGADFPQQTRMFLADAA